MLIQEVLSDSILGAAITVHRELGSGLLESAYEECLAREFVAAGLHFTRQAKLPFLYEGQSVDRGYRLDFIVEESVVVEVKSVESLAHIHEAQILTYLKLSGLRVGLLLNFNVALMIDGIKRFVL
jgi:GxxExxY protein